MSSAVDWFTTLDSTSKFGFECFGFGLLVILLDWAVLYLQGTSLLGISYGSKNRFLVLFFWAVGAGLFGLLGTLVSIVQATLQSAIIVSIAWPVLFTRLIAYAGTPNQPQTNEE